MPLATTDTISMYIVVKYNLFYNCSQEVELYSPQYHISEVPKEVKVLVAYGEEDSPPFKSQGDDYHKVRGN